MKEGIQSAMNLDEMDRVLSGGGELVPSSGFAASVIEAVRQEAAVPAPIPFPWEWALPGLLASVGLVVFFIVRFLRDSVPARASVLPAVQPPSLSLVLPHELANASIRLGVEWSAVALLVSLAAVWLSMRIARGGE